MSSDNKYVLFSLCILILFFLLFSIPMSLNKKENFYTNSGYIKKYCPSCRGLSRNQSNQCYNCGYCISANGSGRSVPGNHDGPYYDTDCLYYDYGDPYFYYPYSHAYPVIKTKTLYPQQRDTLVKPIKYIY